MQMKHFPIEYISNNNIKIQIGISSHGIKYVLIWLRTIFGRRLNSATFRRTKTRRADLHVKNM